MGWTVIRKGDGDVMSIHLSFTGQRFLEQIIYAMEEQEAEKESPSAYSMTEKQEMLASWLVEQFYEDTMGGYFND